MNRLIGILFILIALAICINIYFRLPDLFNANGLADSSRGWYNKLAWELIKGIFSVILLKAGFKRLK